MDVGKIVSNSLKYPFRNIKKLPILFMLFVLVALIPIGMVLDNRYILICGFIAFFIFILFVPGYLFSMVRIGIHESAVFPSLTFGNTIYDSIRLWVLRMAYMIVPALVFFISLSTVGMSSLNMLYEFKIPSFILAFGMVLLLVLVVYIIFEVLLFFAKARLAYLDSLTEALKINRVLSDIRNIGIFNIIKWLIIMAILMIVVSVVSSWIIAIPYVGLLIYIGVVLPILESIGNYSLGLLYSNIARNSNDLSRIEKELNELNKLN
ncbi:MAG: DUF4013 domain-containing protein [Methanobrevibacter sp.]|jgi:hypothetical protein|uniref:DUF4013 domain-containing protein n=1 Tax=Methanobrevibacter sp. TaxID=66852 RepID=UPI0025FA06A5|nr:DUF4013 domain-containing protein [Methanobrevibacter sp.]MBE6497584.1 DUF4013 domain-containing protein [Methanobrevibacter sp.]